LDEKVAVEKLGGHALLPKNFSLVPICHSFDKHKMGRSQTEPHLVGKDELIKLGVQLVKGGLRHIDEVREIVSRGGIQAALPPMDDRDLQRN
jgi:hypothetical protein